MTEPQVWTVIGAFIAAMGTMITLVLVTIRAMFGRFEARMDMRFERVDARFERIETRLESLDRDVSALIRDRFGYDRGQPDAT